MARFKINILPSEGKFIFTHRKSCTILIKSELTGFSYRAAEREGQRGQFATGSKGASSTYINTFIDTLFICIKEPPNRGRIQVLRVPPDSVPQIPLLSAPSARFDHIHKGPHFAILPWASKTSRRPWFHIVPNKIGRLCCLIKQWPHLRRPIAEIE